MSKKQWLIVTLPVLIIVIGLILLIVIPSPSKAPSQNVSESQQNPAAEPATSEGSAQAIPQSQAVLDDTIKVTTPLMNAIVHSPLTITGQARGNWFFEASAPVELLDGNGKVLAQGHITATGEWMTTGYVPFTAVLTFATPSTKTGTLVLKNDNPSGDPTHQKELDIPVTF